MAWDEALKAKVIQAYKDKNPTAETSSEIVKELAEEYEQSPNGVRMLLVQAGVYVKKAEAPAAGKEAKAETGSKRVSKESSIAALKEAIRAKGKDVDDDILDKLTGKAAVYLAGILA